MDRGSLVMAVELPDGRPHMVSLQEAYALLVRDVVLPCSTANAPVQLAAACSLLGQLAEAQLAVHRQLVPAVLGLTIAPGDVLVQSSAQHGIDALVPQHLCAKASRKARSPWAASCRTSLQGKCGVSMEQFIVYSHFMRAGYIITRSPARWTVDADVPAIRDLFVSSCSLLTRGQGEQAVLWCPQHQKPINLGTALVVCVLLTKRLVSSCGNRQVAGSWCAVCIAVCGLPTSFCLLHVGHLEPVCLALIQSPGCAHSNCLPDL